MVRDACACMDLLERLHRDPSDPMLPVVRGSAFVVRELVTF